MLSYPQFMIPVSFGFAGAAVSVDMGIPLGFWPFLLTLLSYGFLLWFGRRLDAYLVRTYGDEAQIKKPKH